MKHPAISELRSLLRRLAPNWHPSRYKPIRSLVMGYVGLRRPEVMPVRYGFDLRIPKRDRSLMVLSLYLDGEYEPEESRWILELLSPGDLVFDVGANVGYMTCLMAQAVAGGEDGQVHAFEPEPANFELLRQNIASNHLTGVLARRMALSSRTGKESIYLARENLGDHTLVKLPGRRSIPIEAVSFDDYYAAHCAGRQVRLVKIDVQGYELEVLKGMQRSLRAGLIDALLLEFWPARLKRSGTSSSELPALLETMPYDATILSDTGGGAYESPEAIRAACDAVERNPHLSFNIVLKRRDSSAT